MQMKYVQRLRAQRMQQHRSQPRQVEEAAAAARVAQAARPAPQLQQAEWLSPQLHWEVELQPQPQASPQLWSLQMRLPPLLRPSLLPLPSDRATAQAPGTAS